MSSKPTYEELEKRVRELERAASEHRQAEETLVRSARDWQATFDAAKDAIWILDEKQRILRCNKTSEVLFQRSREEMIGRSCWEIVHGTKQPIPECPAQRAMHSLKRETMEFQIGRKWFQITVDPLPDTNDGYTGSVHMVSDITERKQMENKLKESEEKYRNLFENGSDLLCIHDLEGNLLETNLSYKKQYGLGNEHLRGLNIRDFMPDRHKPEFDQYLKRIIQNGEDEGYLRIFIKSGEKVILEYRNKLIYGEEGRPIAVQGSARDVTKRLMAEKALKESEEKFKSIFDNATEGIALTDIGTKEFVMGNQVFCSMFGYNLEEIIGLRVEDMHPPNDLPRVLREFESQAKGEKTLAENVPCLRSDGTIFYADINAASIEMGVRKYNIGFFRDVTERRRMEEEILKGQKLESLGILAGGIAHDFNNILTAILGNVSMARDRADPESEIFELLGDAETASKRAQTLTKQLLTFAKGGTPVKETASVGDIIKESSLFVLRGSKSGCEFSISEGLWPVDVDVGQISQVINNIVINANHAMPEGGIIEIKAENLVMDEGNAWRIKPGRYVRISIKDEGVGIAKKYLSKIFDPYFTTKQEGSGLGLATAHSIIKKHGGIIMAESRSGIGATFHISLPASEKAIPEKGAARPVTGKGRVLVMDDEASLRKMVGRMLDKLGYDPEFAKDGDEAIRMVKEAKGAKKPYDAVILDLTVSGGMGGKEAIQKLQEIDSEVKAIVSSGYSDDPVLANFQDYGFKGMIPKPFESLSLSRVLYEVLQKEKE